MPKYTNPKDKVGSKKISISKFPAAALINAAAAMMEGADKYGPYNWRDEAIHSSIYVDAAMRHILAWFEGEELAIDSNCHHLGHAIACLAIILDANMHGNLIDDRPNCPVRDAYYAEVDKITRQIEARRAQQGLKTPGEPTP